MGWLASFCILDHLGRAMWNFVLGALFFELCIFRGLSHPGAKDKVQSSKYKVLSSGIDFISVATIAA